MAHLPTYGYRRVWALLRLSREQTGAPCIIAKRGLSINCCCAPGVRRDNRQHHGRVAVDLSDIRWCSDGFELQYDDGTPLRVT